MRLTPKRVWKSAITNEDKRPHEMLASTIAVEKNRRDDIGPNA